MALSVSNSNALQPVRSSTAPPGSPLPPAASTQPANRTQGDSQLAQDFASVAVSQKGNRDATVQVPAHSTFGLWRDQLARALENPAFQEWLANKGVAPSSVVLYPATNSISVMLNNQRSTFTLGDDSGWSAVAGPVMAASKVISSGENVGIFYETAFSGMAKLGTVAAFYNVSPHKESVDELIRTQQFAPIAANDPGRSPTMRGDEALATQRNVVREIHTRYNRDTLFNTLTRLSDAIAQGTLANQQIAAVLQDKKIDVSSDNAYLKAQPSSSSPQVSLAQYIVANGWSVPKSAEEVDALKVAISTSRSIEPPNDNAAAPGDAELVAGYTEALQRQSAGGKPGLVRVPHQTVLGQWLSHYRAQIESPVVQAWLREQKADPATLTIIPSTGAMSAKVNGVLKNFSLTDNSGWGQIAGPLLAAGKVIAPEPGQALHAFFGAGFMAAPLEVVARFHGEPETPQADQRISHLDSRKAFDAIAPTDTLRPVTARSPQALELQQRNAKRFYTTAPQALAYKSLAVSVATAYPNVHNEAKQWAGALIEQLSGQKVDADTLYLNRFHGWESPAPGTVNGYSHSQEEPFYSKRLPEALLDNFSEHDQLPGELDAQAGIYKVGPGESKRGGYGAHNEFPVAPSALMHASWKTDFQANMTQKITDFWNTHGTGYRTLLKGEYVGQARQQLKDIEAKTPIEQKLLPDEQKFTRSDYELVMGAVSNLPLNERTPLTAAQLQAEAPVKGIVRAHAFDINGFKSNDIIRFTEQDDGNYAFVNGRRDGRQILYIPGAKPAFLRFDSLEKMDQWVVEQGKDPQKRRALEAHFSLADRQDNATGGFWKTLLHVVSPITNLIGERRPKDGVETSLEHLGAGATDKLEGTIIDRGNFAIEGDVFSAIRDATQQRMISDADTAIKSDSEVTRDTWLNDISAAAGLLAKLAPIAVPVAATAIATGLTEAALGTEKTLSGDTEVERRDGASKAFDGVLNTLFSLGTSGAAEDPFAPPPEKQLSSAPTLTEQAVANGVLDNRSGRGLPNIEPTPNRLQPSQSGNISAHAVPDGEQLIERGTRNAKGIYQVKSDTGMDQWFIRYTDESGVAKVYEIRGDFKLSDDYVQIIDRQSAKPVLTVNANGNGGWVRSSGEGGVRLWPWQRPVSPTPSNELKIPRTFSDEFVDLDGSKIPEAEKFDKYLNIDEKTNYEISSTNYEENAVIKRKLSIAWTFDDGDFAVSASEKATPSTFGQGEYSEQFTKDINRNPYTVRIKNGDTLEIDIAKQIRALNLPSNNVTQSITDDFIKENIARFEKAIPNAELRARISEVAHQGSAARTWIELQPPRLKENYISKAGDRHFYIDYDPATKQTQVTVTSQWQLTYSGAAEPEPVSDLEITSTRTFTLRESNNLEDHGLIIDTSTPTRIEVSVI
jgi:hypothetical protein